MKPGQGLSLSLTKRLSQELVYGLMTQIFLKILASILLSDGASGCDKVERRVKVSTDKNIANRSETQPTMQVFTRREWPLVGSLFDFMGNDGLAFLLSLAQQSDVCCFHLGPIPCMLFNKAEYAQSVLVDHGYDCTKGRLMHAAFSGGNGLFI